VLAFGARLIRSGSVSNLLLIKASGREGFDMDARVAADFARGDPILVAMPASVPDSLVVLIAIGRHQDGSNFMLRHEWCPAAALPDNPPPEYPTTATIWRSRATVRVRYAVDSLGGVDSASVAMLDPTSTVFENAVLLYLRKARYLPAEFDGAPERQTFTRSIVFVPPEDSTAASP
jgi:TonB family protein